MKKLLTLPFLLFPLTFLIAQTKQAARGSVNVEWNADSLSDVSTRMVQGTAISLETTGPKPTIVSKPLKYARDAGATTLSFDYFVPKGISRFEIYFYSHASLTATKSIEKIGFSEGWVGYTIDLTPEVKNWGAPGDYLAFALGNKSNVSIQLRNTMIRSLSAQEKDMLVQRERKKAQEAVMELNLKKYLSEEYSSNITHIKVDDEQINIQGNTPDTGSLYLCEVTPYMDVTEEQNFAAMVKVGGGDFTEAVSRFEKRNGINYDRLLSKWVLVKKTSGRYQLASHARYFDEVKPAADLEKEVAKGKKGLGGFSTNRGHTKDLDELNITSATVNIWFARFMYTTPAAGRIEHNYNGKSYYFDSKQVNIFDSTFLMTSSKGIITAAIILIDKAEDCPDPAIGNLLQHPDMDPAGIYSMPNMTNPASVDCYAAALDFLASRYSRPDRKYGRLNHWIMHNEVDAGWEWTNMGIKTASVFMDAYVKSMRLCYAIARKYNPYSEVFISLTHYWAWTDHPRFYPSKELMELLLQYTKAEGDFQWAMAQHPYPQSLFEPKTWLDQQVTFDFNSPLITFKNLEVLSAWIKQPAVLYRGKYKRTLWLSENGTNSKSYSDSDLAEQAAGFAYTWKKMKRLDGIDGFQWHNWYDNRHEGGLRIGLRRFPDDEKDPGGPKPVWYAYKAADTKQEDAVFDPYKKLIGIQDWNEVNYLGEIDPARKNTSFRNNRKDSWVATDALGRTLPGYQQCGPLKKDRYVGMFYFMTHVSPGGNGPYNVSQIINASPDAPQWGSGSHYWGEPELGYYLNYDKWVIRRHAMQLSDAGVDVIIFDVTNDVTFPQVYLPICETYREMRNAGEKTPDIAFLGSEISVNTLWKEFYQKGMYADLWFQWKGRPLILFGQHEIPSRKKNNDIVFSDEINSFFNIRQSWAWTTLPWYEGCPFGKNKWPWVDHYPQAAGWNESPERPEQMPVAVAEHPLSNIGRSFHNFYEPQTDKYDLTPFTPQGLFFEEQWSRAIEVQPEFVFVTGWNEWSAGKVVMGKDISKELQQWKFYPGAHLGKAGRELKTGDTYFIDQYNEEFSRDIEPMAGGHTDNYYYQLVANVRRYKGMEAPDTSSSSKTIDINGSFDQWTSVTRTYYDHVGDTVHRYSPGEGKSGPYVNNSGRNDIIESKVTTDQVNFYFYVKCSNTISPYNGSNWMLLFIDADRNKKTGWEGYDYVVNGAVEDNSTTTIRPLGNKNPKSEKIKYKLAGNELMITVPRTALKLTTDHKFEFHWADNIQKTGDIKEFFINGDNAPERRFNYLFTE